MNERSVRTSVRTKQRKTGAVTTARARSAERVDPKQAGLADPAAGMIEEAHSALPSPTSGTLASNPDDDRFPVRDPGVSIEPEQTGSQFLRNATQQDNFEGELPQSAAALDTDPAVTLLAEEATSQALAEEHRRRQTSGALDGRARRGPGPESTDVEIPTVDMTLLDRFLGEDEAEEGDLEPIEDDEVEPPSGVALRPRRFL